MNPVMDNPASDAKLPSLWGRFFQSRKTSLRSRLLVAFVIVVLIPALTVSLVSAMSSVNITDQRLYNQLDSVATLKESEIKSWVTRQKEEITGLAVDWEIINNAAALMRGKLDPDFEVSRTKVLTQLSNTQSRSRLFDEIFMLDLTGQVIISTLTDQAGKSYSDQLVFTGGREEITLTPPLYSPSLKSYRILVSHPVLDKNGDRIGVVAARANLETLNNILLERAGLGQTGETYLVGTNNVLVTVLRSGAQYLTVRTYGSERSLKSHVNGANIYTNPTGNQVYGVYRWIPDLQVALLAEQQREEALAPLRLTIAVNAGVTLLALLFAVAVAYWITHTIVRPIGDLVQTATQIAAGNLDLEAPITHRDEIGELAVAFNSMSRQLRSIVTNLEDRVQERTHDLERRTLQIRTAAEVSRDITTTTNLDMLFNRSVNLIRERFGFYHAGLFLLDERNEYAVLRAATGEAGIQMLSREHKLRVGQHQVGIVGAAASSGQPRVALDVASDSAHFKNPFLPNTQSEVGLPLKVGDRVIGVLDVQSEQAHAFDEEDINSLQSMADQLAVAIENARLIQRMNRTVQELEQAYRRYTRESWRSFARRLHPASGFRYHRLEVEPYPDPQPETLQAYQVGQPVISTQSAEEEGQITTVAVPIKLRDEIIGALNLRFAAEQVAPETVAIIEEAAGRLALVLENVRLLQDAQRLATREQQINLISTEIRSSINIETILQNTVRELGKAIGASRAFIQLQEL